MLAFVPPTGFEPACVQLSFLLFRKQREYGGIFNFVENTRIELAFVHGHTPILGYPVSRRLPADLNGSC